MVVAELKFQVWHPLTLLNGRYVSDLIFRDGKPVIVALEGASHAAVPVLIELDRRHLHRMKEADVQYLYDGEMGFTGQG